MIGSTIGVEAEGRQGVADEMRLIGAFIDAGRHAVAVDGGGCRMAVVPRPKPEAEGSQGVADETKLTGVAKAVGRQGVADETELIGVAVDAGRHAVAVDGSGWSTARVSDDWLGKPAFELGGVATPGTRDMEVTKGVGFVSTRWSC